MKPLALLVAVVLCCAPLSAETPEVATDITTTPAGELMLHLSFLTTASPEKLWRALTVPDELTKWAARKVRVELRLGGAYEHIYKPDAPMGRRGMEGTRIVSFVPNKMLSYSGGADTWAVWMIEPAGDQQVLHFYMLGTTSEWNETGGTRLPALTETMEKLAKYVQP
jgi:uncharacterized protein YndB with AHSA1/START domain